MRQVQIALPLCLALSSCGGGTAPAPLQTRPFPMVKAPSVLEGDEVLTYSAAHYWDAFLDTSTRWVSDSTHIMGVDAVKVEEQVGTYSTILGMLPLEEARSSVSALFGRMEACADSSAFEALTEMICRYLYDPNSPVRNEDIYQPFARGLSLSPRVPASRRKGYEWEAEMCSLNSVGTPAADFTFTDIRGRRHTLYGIDAPLTLLFFSNPGCPNCREIMDVLTSDEMSFYVNAGTLAVVNVYIDEDLDAWREYEHNYPRSWYTGYDQDMLIRTDLVYNVRAIPSLYLLDEDKTVILKDAPLEKVLEVLGM